MGTSTSYGAPTTPQWQQVKTEVTRSARSGRPSVATARSIVRHYITANDGARGIAGGGGVTGGSRAASSVGRRLAGFVSSVSSGGLRQALQSAGLGSLEGKPVEQIIVSLADYLGGDANTIDDADLRSALLDLTSELLEDASGFEEVEEILQGLSKGDTLNSLLVRFFGHYLYEQFCRVFYERLVERVGQSNADQFLGGIRDFIMSALEHEMTGRDLAAIDWMGEEGREIADTILVETLEVYSRQEV